MFKSLLAALLIAASTALAGEQTTKYLIPDPSIGGYELRDNAGRTTGYVIEDPGIGGFDLQDVRGQWRGFVLPNDDGSFRVEQPPGLAPRQTR